MTDFQSIMLSFSFGTCAGFMIGNIIVLIKLTIEERREKKKRKAEEEAEKAAKE